MTIEELQRLLIESDQTIDRIKTKYEMGCGLTRKDCNEMRHATQRLGIIAKELWVQLGKPDMGPGSEWLDRPIPLSPLPKCFQPLDLTPYGGREVH